MRRLPPSLVYMFFSALGFALMAGCVKAVHLRGIPVLEIIAVRAFISLVLSGVDITRKKLNPWGNNTPLLLVRGLMGTAALISVFYAVTLLPLAEATLIQYLYPVLTAIIALIFLKESIQKATILALFFSLAGLVIIARPDILPGVVIVNNAPPLAAKGLLFALIGAMGTATAYVMVRKLSQSEDPSVIIFSFPFIALPISLIFLGTDGIMPQGLDWVLLVLVGVLAQFGQYTLTLAMTQEKVAITSAFAYIQIVFSAIIGWLFFHEIPTTSTVVGAVCIIGGALINLRATEKS